MIPTFESFKLDANLKVHESSIRRITSQAKMGWNQVGDTRNYGSALESQAEYAKLKRKERSQHSENNFTTKDDNESFFSVPNENSVLSYTMQLKD